MARIVESLATINSFVRTVLAVIIVAFAGAVGYYAYQNYLARDLAMKTTSDALVAARSLLAQKQVQIEEQLNLLAAKDTQITVLNAEIKSKNEKIDKLDTSLRLLKVNHRIAWLTVTDQYVDTDTKTLQTAGRFVEVNDKNEPVGTPKPFRIEGDVVYVDNWIVKFEDKFVEKAEIDRTTSLVLFRRIFGESQTPNNGIPLDAVGSRPQIYGRGGQMSDLEKHLWNEFWSIANDEAKAKELGIRAAHGEAVSMKLQKGKSYKIQLRASDGLSITPDSGAPPFIGNPISNN
jgi:hypothetical protein